jgi:hypothetical protein
MLRVKRTLSFGFRANSRKIPEGQRGHRIARQPKTPKPNFAKGEHLTNLRALRKQAEANTRLQAKKTASRAAHATTKRSLCADTRTWQHA